MAEKIILKSKYQITQLVSEDILSFFYIGNDFINKKKVNIIQYKKEFLNESLIKKLADYSQRVINLGSHPYVLTLLDFLPFGGSFYTISEFIEAEPISTWTEKQQTIQSDVIRNIIQQIVSAMLFLENNKLVCGNLNAYALLIDKTDTVHLSQLILHILILKPIILKTAIVDEGVFFAPEFLIKQDYSIRSDIYSFGVLLYYLYTKKWPYFNTPEIRLLKKSLLKPLTPAVQIMPSIPPLMNQIIEICLKKNPSDRFSSFFELKEVLIGNQPIEQTESNSISWFKKALLKDIQKGTLKKIQHSLIYGIITSIIILILLGTYISYNNFFNAVPNIVVPNVVGIAKEDALIILANNHLQSQVIGEYLRTDIPSGFVVETKPPAGRLVKQNRQIRLFISKSPYIVKLPSLVGSTIEEAPSILDQGSLKINSISQDYSDKFEAGNIIEQSPPADSTINIQEDIVQVILSKGFPVACTVKIVTPNSTDEVIFSTQIKWFVPESWEDKSVEILKIYHGNMEKLYSGNTQPGQNETKNFLIEKNAKIEVYFNNKLAYKTTIIAPQSEYLSTQATHNTD